MGPEVKAIQDTYATSVMIFVVVFLGLQATAVFATPLEQERFFYIDQERFFDLCEKITAITTKDGKGWIHPIKDWICGTTTSTLPPTTTTEEVTTTTSTLPPECITEQITTTTSTEEFTTTEDLDYTTPTGTTEDIYTETTTIPSTTTTEEIITTTSTIPPTTTTEEVTTEKVTLAPPTGGKCYAIGEHAGIAGWNMWCQVNCNQVPITNCPADQCACQKN